MCLGNLVIALSSMVFRLLLLHNQLSPNLAASNDCFIWLTICETGICQLLVEQFLLGVSHEIVVRCW